MNKTANEGDVDYLTVEVFFVVTLGLLNPVGAGAVEAFLVAHTLLTHFASSFSAMTLRKSSVDS